MKRTLTSKSFRCTIFIVLVSIIIALTLGIAIWDINFWPTDTRVYYFDAALELRNLKYVSQMHELIDQERVKWLHGKEMFILSASIVQKIMQDYETLRPFIVVCLFSLWISTILIFFISRDYWGRKAGLVCFFLFSTSFWPYIYVLFAKHQPLGLCFFLLAVYCLQRSRPSKLGAFFSFLSGCFVGIMLFSSSISALYLPYYIGAYVWHYYVLCRGQSARDILKALVLSLSLITVGFVGAFLYFNFPNIIENVKSYWEYVKISGSYNHFFYNQRILQQWISTDIPDTRGGWLWIFRYYKLIMPVLFPLFLGCNAFVFLRCVSIKKASLKFRLLTLTLLLLCWSSPILAEVRGVAQYGGNYFTSIIGILALVGYTVYLLSISDFIKSLHRMQKMMIGCVVLYAAIFHTAINGYVFLDDIYPTRMATTFLSKKIMELDDDKIYTYNRHPLKTHMIAVLNPAVFETKQLTIIQHINQVSSGYILLPPVTGNSIYNVATSFYTDYDNDIFVNELLRKGVLEDYAVASYKTLASSRIWPHEEEILTYRFLILNQFSDDIIEKGKVWLLDAKKLRRDVFKNAPTEEYMFLTKNNILNIGTKQPIYIYKGFLGILDKNLPLKGVVARMYKMGSPTDQLHVYIYRVDDVQNMWVPFDENFKSLPVDGKILTHDSKGDNVYFYFPKPLFLRPGNYYFAIYRTGESDDENYYRIYKEQLGNLLLNFRPNK